MNENNEQENRQLDFLGQFGFQPLPPDALRIFSNEKIIDEAFKYYRTTGFPYKKAPLHVNMQEINKLANCDNDTLLHTTLGYTAADTYHPHRLHANAHGMRSPYESFQIDKSLKHALELKLEFGDIGSGWITTFALTLGTQACSNFRPGIALKYYKDFCKEGDVILDTSTGYGGRLIGFIAFGKASTYIGIDPNTETCIGNTRLAADLGVLEKVSIFCSPVEDLDPLLLKERCDFAFTSPPYFNREIYSNEETQSYKRYLTVETWVEKFLKAMLLFQFNSLKHDSFSVVNIANLKTNKGVIKLVDYTIQKAEEVGFTYMRTDTLDLQHRLGKNMEEEVAVEPILVFKKV